MIRLAVAPSGAGKTILMVHDMYKKWSMWGQRNNRTIYTNLDVAFPHEKVNSVDEIMRISNADIYIDEFDVVFHDPRKSSSDENIAGTIAAKIARKNNVSLYGTIQKDTMADVRVRANTDVWKTPVISLWCNVKTGETMQAPLSFFEYEKIEMTLDENYKRVWEPALIDVWARKLSGDTVISSEFSTINCQKIVYKGKNILECFDTSQVILKKTIDNEAIKKASSLESLLTSKLRKSLAEEHYNILRMPRSGQNMSYSTDYFNHTCLDILVTHERGKLLWLDVVGLKKINGRLYLNTQHKNWGNVEDSIKQYGRNAEGWITFFMDNEWKFFKIDLKLPLFYTSAKKLKKSPLYLKKVLEYTISFEEFLKIIRG